MAKELDDSVKNIQSLIDTSALSFSYGLDDYAQFLGDVMNLDIKDYADLTALANASTPLLIPSRASISNSIFFAILF